MKRIAFFLLLAFAAVAPARAQAPAARVGDLTDHGGTIVGPGVPTVMISGQPAAILGDQTICPLVDGMVPHVGGPIVTGSVTVFIGGRPAVRSGDRNVENGPPATIIGGAVTVMIGP